MSRVRYVCGTCGSTDVLVDAYAAWDETTQEWYVRSTFDKGDICEACDGETRVKMIPIPEQETPT